MFKIKLPRITAKRLGFSPEVYIRNSELCSIELLRNGCKLKQVFASVITRQ